MDRPRVSGICLISLPWLPRGLVAPVHHDLDRHGDVVWDAMRGHGSSDATDLRARTSTYLLQAWSSRAGCVAGWATPRDISVHSGKDVSLLVGLLSSVFDLHWHML